MTGTYRISGMQQIAARLDSSNTDVILFRPEIGKDGSDRPLPFFAYIDTLRAKIQVRSTPEAELPPGFDDLDGVEQRNELQSLMYVRAHLRFEIVIEANGASVTPAYIGAINRPPFYHFSLMSFLTDAASFPVAAGTTIRARFVDDGWGGPTFEDSIEIFGSARTEAPAFSQPPPQAIILESGGGGELLPANALYNNSSPIYNNSDLVIN